MSSLKQWDFPQRRTVWFVGFGERVSLYRIWGYFTAGRKSRKSRLMYGVDRIRRRRAGQLVLIY